MGECFHTVKTFETYVGDKDLYKRRAFTICTLHIILGPIQLLGWIFPLWRYQPLLFRILYSLLPEEGLVFKMLYWL